MNGSLYMLLMLLYSPSFHVCMYLRAAIMGVVHAWLKEEEEEEEEVS